MAREEVINRVVGIRHDGSWVEIARGITLERAEEVRSLAIDAHVFDDVLILTMASGQSSC